MAHSVPHNPLNHREHAARAAQGRAAPQHSPVVSSCFDARGQDGVIRAATAPLTHVNLDRCRLSLIKGEHRWRFRWERGSEAALISAVADLARNPHMEFDWFDAAVVCRHIAQAAPPPAAEAAEPPVSPAPRCD
jgi:hypothetical protein